MESRQILEILYAQFRSPRYQLRLKWTPGTLGIWDNFRTQHYAVGDHYPNYREMHRVTVARSSRRLAGREGVAA